MTKVASTKTAKVSLADLVDELGPLSAQIKKLVDRQEYIKDVLKDSGKIMIKGTQYVAMIKNEERSTVDQLKVKELLGDRVPYKTTIVVKCHVSAVVERTT